MIYSFSKFNYGQTATLASQNILFKEGTGPTLTAQIPIGGYSLEDYVSVIQSQLNSTGNLIYTVTVDRATNQLTISSTGAFSLLTSQGATAFTVMGFTQTSDLTGQTSYAGQTQCGQQYRPQFMLQSYLPSTNNSSSIDATVNQSASGRVEVVRFGVNRFIELDIKFISSLRMDGIVIRNNPNGLSDALSFMNYATTKQPFEFVPDEKLPSTFQKVLLEKTPDAADGTGYKLKELFTDSIPDVYETGLLTLRVIQ